MSVYTTGTWTPNPGREDAFVEAWSEFAAWASSMPGAGRLRLVRDMNHPEHFTSFGEWQKLEDVRAWKSSVEFRERMAQVLQHVGNFQPTELELVAEADDGAVAAAPAGTVHYRHDAIATFEVSVDAIVDYMSAGGHQHAAFKRHELVSIDGNVVTVAAEVYNPDGSTFEMRIEHTLDPPAGIETRMIGGPFDGARFTHTYTTVTGGTRVDLEGEFPMLPGMSQQEELAMIDGFFTTVFDEDAASLRVRSPHA